MTSKCRTGSLTEPWGGKTGDEKNGKLSLNFVLHLKLLSWSAEHFVCFEAGSHIILLPPPPKCSVYKHASRLWFYGILGIYRVLGKGFICAMHELYPLKYITRYQAILLNFGSYVVIVHYLLIWSPLALFFFSPQCSTWVSISICSC